MKSKQFTRLQLGVLTAIATFLLVTAAVAGTPAIEASSSEAAQGADRYTVGHGRARVKTVRCDRGRSLSRAIRHAKPGDTLNVYGTCFESVKIRTDRLTLHGRRGATIDGSSKPSEAVVTIDGARTITLSNLTIQNGSDQGLLATHQAQAALKQLVLTGNGTVGLAVDRSHLDIEDVTLKDNRSGGMDAFAGSTVVASGYISAMNNGGDGLVANGKTFFELRGAAVTASQNAGSGVTIINDSRLQIFSFPEAQGSKITADSNGFAGIGLMGAELGVVGSPFFGSGANVIEASNNFVGFFMPAGAILSPHATAKFNATGNILGMLLEDNANVFSIGGVNVTNNVTGITANGAGTVHIVSVPPNPSSVKSNKTDFALSFGTRSTLEGVDFDTLECDETVLVRGTRVDGDDVVCRIR